MTDAERPAVGSRWYSAEMLTTYEVVGWTDSYGGMVEAIAEDWERRSVESKVVLLRPTDFGSRLTPVFDTGSNLGRLAP